jgi:hypothetical protein
MFTALMLSLQKLFELSEASRESLCVDILTEIGKFSGTKLALQGLADDALPMQVSTC